MHSVLDNRLIDHSSGIIRFANTAQSKHTICWFMTPRVAICSAFSTDYPAGYISQAVNADYAARHGYEWRCDVLDADDMAAACGGGLRSLQWFKITMLSRVLSERQHSLVVWIDADAVIVKPERTIESIVDEARTAAPPECSCDLIIGEDMTQASLLNTGLMIFRGHDDASGSNSWCWHLWWHW